MSIYRSIVLLLLLATLAACSPPAQTPVAASPSLQGAGIEEEPPAIAEPPPTQEATDTPEPIPGLDVPIVVQGVKLQLTSALLQESFEFYGQMQEPERPEDILLIVMATLIEGEQVGIFAWEVTAIDEQGREYEPGISGVGTVDSAPGDSSLPEIVWLFAVSESAGSFTLKLPEGVTLDLTPLLGEPITQILAQRPPSAPSLPTATRPAPTSAPPPTSPLQPTATPRVPAREAPTLAAAEPFTCPQAQTEDFSSAVNVFSSGSADFATWGVVGGEYSIEPLLPESDARRASTFREEDALIEVSARAAAAGPGAFGLFFGQDNVGERFFTFTTDAHGQYGLHHFSPQAGWETVQDYRASSLLYWDESSNLLQVVRNGQMIALYANGVPLQTALYDAALVGRPNNGVIAWSNEEAGLDARFDNFAVCPLQGPPPMPVDTMLEEVVRWPPEQPLLLYFGWMAASEELVAAFVNTAKITLAVDGHFIEGPAEYWGEPQPYPYGSMSLWRAVLPALSPGLHRIETVVSLSAAVSDGFDGNGDGQLDSYGPGETHSGWVELEIVEQ